jgi:hypothetical protein
LLCARVRETPAACHPASIELPASALAEEQLDNFSQKFYCETKQQFFFKGVSVLTEKTFRRLTLHFYTTTQLLNVPDL